MNIDRDEPDCGISPTDNLLPFNKLHLLIEKKIFHLLTLAIIFFLKVNERYAPAGPVTQTLLILVFVHNLQLAVFATINVETVVEAMVCEWYCRTETTVRQDRKSNLIYH